MATLEDAMSEIAPLSLDLDNRWSYLKTHGDDSWRDLSGYLDTVVPRILSILAERRMEITFFIVGQDAELAENREAIGAVADAGHEIGNHSFHHEPWLHLYERAELRSELQRADAAIVAATGKQPVGFRGPGFSLSQATLEELAALGYRYDATIFPNLLNPLGRAYYFMTSNLTREERKQRKALFGTFKDAFRPNAPFRWSLAETDMLEIPVTTMPLARVPIHFSYLIYLGGYSRRLAESYFRFALALCRRRGTPPSLLLHPLDFLGKQDEPDLAFFPGMKMDRGRKLALLNGFLDILQKHYEPCPLGRYADTIRPDTSRPPDFSRG